MNDKVRKRIGAQKNYYDWIYITVDKITQKIAIHYPEDQSVFIIQSADLSHIFGCDLEQKSDRGYIEKKKTTLLSVFLRRYKNKFPNDL